MAIIVITFGDIVGLGLLGLAAVVGIGYGLYRVGNALYWWFRRL